MKIELKEARDWVRHYCFENPGATVDEIAREAKRCHKALHKTEISNIRREVKETISHAQEKHVQQAYRPTPLPSAKGPIVRKAKSTAPFNPPRIRVDQNDPEKDTTVAEAEQAAATPPALPPATELASPPPTPPPSTAIVPVDPKRAEEAEKESWLYEFCEKNPNLNVHEVNEACIEHFGSGFWMPKVASALKFVRQMQGLPVAPPKKKLLGTPKKTEIPTGAEVLQLQKQKTQKELDNQLRSLESAAKELARQMKLTSTRECRILIDDEGGVDFEFKRVEITTAGKKLKLD